MSAIKGTDVYGNVSVGRNVAAGGNARVNGNIRVGHNLKVEGWLEAPNIKDVNKGIFQTLAELQAAYPNPKDGWFAGVGTSTPFAAYAVVNGEWVATGGTIDVEVDLAHYDAVLDEHGEAIGDLESAMVRAENDINLLKVLANSGYRIAGFIGPNNSYLAKAVENTCYVGMWPDTASWFDGVGGRVWLPPTGWTPQGEGVVPSSVSGWTCVNLTDAAYKGFTVLFGYSEGKWTTHRLPYAYKDKVDSLSDLWASYIAEIRGNKDDIDHIESLLTGYYTGCFGMISFVGDRKVIRAGESRTVNFTFDTELDFEGDIALELYADEELVGSYTVQSREQLPYHFGWAVDDDCLFKLRAKVNGLDYVSVWDVEAGYDFWVGTGATYGAVLANDSARHRGDSDMGGTYSLSPSSGQYVFIICRSNKVPSDVKMSGFAFPMVPDGVVDVSGVEYAVYRSANSMQSATFDISIDSVGFDKGSYITHLLARMQELADVGSLIEEKVETIADEETITVNENSKVALKNRPMKRDAVTDEVIQKGYVILKEGDDFKEVVEGYTEGNVIFEIDYAFDLGGEEVEIPENCTLKFEGGKLSNGELLASSNFEIKGNPTFYEVRVDIAGTEENHIKNITIENVVFDFAPEPSTLKAPLHFLWCDDVKVNNITVKNRYSSGYSLYTTDYYSTIGFVDCNNVSIKNVYLNEGISGTAFAMYWCKDVYIENLVLDDRKNTRSSLTTAAELYFCETVNVKSMFVHSSAVSDWSSVDGNFTGIYSLVNIACRDLIIENSYFYGGKCVDLSNELTVAIGGKQPSEYAPSNFDTTSVWGLKNECVKSTTIKSGMGVEFGARGGNGCGKIIVENCDIEVLVPHLGNYYFGIRVWDATDIDVIGNSLLDCGNILNVIKCENDVKIKVQNNVVRFDSFAANFYVILDMTDGNGKFTDVSILNNVISTTNLVYLIQPPRHDVGSLRFCNNNFDVASLRFNSSRSTRTSGFDYVEFVGNTITEHHSASVYSAYVRFDDYIDNLFVSNNKTFKFAFELLGVNTKQIVNNTFMHDATNARIVSVQGAQLDNCVIEKNMLFNTTNNINDGIVMFILDESDEAYKVGPDILIRDNKCKYTYYAPATEETMKLVWESSNELSSNADSTIRTKGKTANRPTRINYAGLKYYDTQIKKLITWDGDAWKEADGAVAGVARSGTFANKPAAADIYVGFSYFCTSGASIDGGTTEKTNFVIYHKGSGAWVDANGTAVVAKS